MAKANRPASDINRHKGLHRHGGMQAFEDFHVGTIAPSLPTVLDAGSKSLDPVVRLTDCETRSEVGIRWDGWREQVRVDGCIDLIAWSQDACPEDTGVADVEFEPFG